MIASSVLLSIWVQQLCSNRQFRWQLVQFTFPFSILKVFTVESKIVCRYWLKHINNAFLFSFSDNMTWKILLTCFIMFLVGITLSTEQQIDLNRNKSEAKILSRKKRFLIFPTGSSFSVATCMTVGVYGNPQFSLWSWGLNYGFAYNLPSNSSYFTRPPDDLFAVPFFTDPMGPPPPPPPETPPPDTTSVPPSGHDIHDDYHDHYPSAPSDILGETNQQFPTDLPAGPAQRKYSTYYQPKYETKPMMQRRYRRDIYRNIESVINK